MSAATRLRGQLEGSASDYVLVGPERKERLTSA